MILQIFRFPCQENDINSQIKVFFFLILYNFRCILIIRFELSACCIRDFLNFLRPHHFLSPHKLPFSAISAALLAYILLYSNQAPPSSLLFLGQKEFKSSFSFLEQFLGAGFRKLVGIEGCCAAEKC